MSTEARDLRALLEAVLEALTVPSGADADRRIVDRAMWAEVTIRGAMEDSPEDIAFNTDFLRRKLRREEEAARK